MPLHIKQAVHNLSTPSLKKRLLPLGALCGRIGLLCQKELINQKREKEPGPTGLEKG